MKGLSLFASGGISEYYLNNTNVDIKVANELIPKRCEFYQELYPNSKIICGDISDKKIFNIVLKEARKQKVNFIMATPPCQGMSKCGQMKFNDPRNSLFIHIINMIKKLKPDYSLIENVPEFLKTNYLNENNQEEKIMDRLNNELKELYHIEATILNAQDYDVPQSRNRAILLLSKKEKPIWKHPPSINKIITVRDAIGNLPSLESEQKLDKKKYPKKNQETKNMLQWHYGKKHNDNHILWMQHTPTGKSAFDNEIHYPKKDGRKIRGFKTTYKRIEWDKPAPTITMSSGSVSSQNNVHPGQMKKNKIWDNARVLSVYEILILTSLPKDIKLPKCTTEKLIRDLCGESVPSKFMYNIIKSIPQISEDL